MPKKLSWALLILANLFLALPVWILWQDFSLTGQPIKNIHAADKAVILATKAYENGQLNPCLIARVQAGAELYQAGKIKKLVMSGGINRDHQYGSRNMQIIAEKMGVPAEAIEQEDQSSNTFENIIFSRKFIENSPSVILVSAGFHLPRARWIAEKQWSPKEIQVYAAPSCSEPYGGYGYSILRESGSVLKAFLNNHH